MCVCLCVCDNLLSILKHEWFILLGIFTFYYYAVVDFIYCITYFLTAVFKVLVSRYLSWSSVGLGNEWCPQALASTGNCRWYTSFLFSNQLCFVKVVSFVTGCAVNSVAISADGTQLAAACDSGTIQVFDVRNGASLFTLTEHQV